MISKLPCDIQNYILSFLIGNDNITKTHIMDQNYTSVKYLTHDVLFLLLTSKEWNRLINNYIKHFYKNYIIYYRTGIIYASEKGNISVLEWFKKKSNVYNVRYNNLIIETACEYGRINVLEWVKANNYTYKYNLSSAIVLASKSGHVNVLEWWENSGYHFSCTESAIEMACLFGHLDVIEWFNSSRYIFKYRWENVLIYSVIGMHGLGGGHVHILEWFKTHIFHNNYLPPLTATIIRNIAWATNVNIELNMIEWLTFNYPEIIETLQAIRNEEDNIEMMDNLHI